MVNYYTGGFYEPGDIQKKMYIDKVLFIIEIAKMSDDIVAWFPRGKWATIQAIEHRIHIAIESIVLNPING